MGAAIVKGSVKGGLWRGIVLSKVKDLAYHGFERGENWVRSIALGDSLIPFTIFLVGKVEQDTKGSTKLCGWSNGGIKQAMGCVKGDILQPEWVVVAGIISVFAGTEQVEETNDQKICNSARDRGSQGSGTEGNTSMVNQGNGNGLDFVRWGILFVVGFGEIYQVFLLEVVGVQAGVKAPVGPQANLLGHGPYVVRYAFSVDRLVAGCESSSAYSRGKNFEKR